MELAAYQIIWSHVTPPLPVTLRYAFDFDPAAESDGTSTGDQAAWCIINRSDFYHYYD